MNSNLEALRHLVGSTLTGWRGSACFRPAAVQPAQLLELYDIESSPYCRMVRETLSELDIDVLIKPCPKGGTRFRKEAIARVGKAQFPLLVDPNTDTVMLESADIIDYLLRTYGGGSRCRHAVSAAQRASPAATWPRSSIGVRAGSVV